MRSIERLFLQGLDYDLLYQIVSDGPGWPHTWFVEQPVQAVFDETAFPLATVAGWTVNSAATSELFFSDAQISTIRARSRYRRGGLAGASSDS